LAACTRPESNRCVTRSCLVVIVILTVVGQQVNNAFSNVSSGLGT
jgi:hypothetical protein